MNAIGQNFEWELAKRIARQDHPAAQFMEFVEATGRPWYGLVFVFDEDPVMKRLEEIQFETIKAFGEFCAKWEPVCERLGRFQTDQDAPNA